MAKTTRTQLTDFDFTKTILKTTPSYFVERIVAICLVAIFVLAFFNTNNTYSIKLDTLPDKQVTSELTKKYADYVVTADDKKMFESIFNYTTSSPISKNTDIKFFNDNMRKDDIKNADFVNKNNNDQVIISSKILSIDSPDKNDIVKQTGFENLDYVDIVVEKTYQKGQEIYFEQQMVNVKMENHKIITINTHRMID